MNYTILLNNEELFSGNVFVLGFIVLCILLLIMALIMTIVRKLRYNEGLKYEFITIIAHKFRTPLTHLKWISEALLTTETEQTTREGLTDIAQSTDKLINMTGTLIDLTNKDSETKAQYQFNRESLNDLVRSVATSLKQNFHEKNIFYTINIPDVPIFANIDKPRMEFVLQTLLENAAIYTPPGREVAINMGIRGRKAVVVVSDKGIGINPGEINNIFTKFYRTQNAKTTDTEGFGIGLFLAQEIVKKHGGKIDVYSEGIDKGTTFEVSLPLVA